MQDDYHDVDQYQNELSDAVDDGGGCAEMWTALTESRKDTDLSRRSVLRRVGGTTAGIALASSLQLAFASTAAASEERSQRVLQIVEASEEFQAVKKQLKSVLRKDDDVSAKDEDELFASRSVQEVEVEETTYWISTHADSIDTDEKHIETSVEISTLVRGETLKQVRGLVKHRTPDETKYVSVTHDTVEMEQTEAVLQDDDRRANTMALAQQAQCIPCTSPYCYSTCVAVWDVICYNDIGDQLCSSEYTTTAACLIITAIGGGVGGAVCAIFLAAVCEGDIGCYDTPENMCEDSASACDDPWLN